MATEAFIFDYGGTLDSRGEHWSRVIRRGYSAAGLEPDEEHFRQAYVHGERTLARLPIVKPTDNFLELMRKKVSVELQWLDENNLLHDIPVEQTCDKIARYCYDSARECVAESRAVLDAVRLKGIPMVLVSNFYGNIHSVLADFGIEGYFSEIIESAVVGVRKPDPQIFALGVNALGLPPEKVTVVGDSYSKDILPALTLGCRAIWLRGPGWTTDDDTKVYADSIHSITELPNVAF